MKKLDEKTKTMAVAALGVVLLGIGAFQFIGGGSKAPAKAPTKPKDNLTAAAAPAPVIVNPDYANPLAPRDPFTPPAADAPQNYTPPKPPVVPKASQMTSGLKGTIPPLLPPIGGAPHGLGGGIGSIGTTPIKPPDPVFSYALHGVIQGTRPAALFADAAGDQRLIPLGGSLDGDTKLTAVGDHGVVVSFHGKDIHLTLGKDPSSK